MNNAKTVLELLYYCSGVVLAFLAAIGLRQISLAKASIRTAAEIAKTSAKRDSFKLAAEQCAVYYNDIVPLVNKYDACLEKRGLSAVMEGWLTEINGDRIKIRPKSRVIKERYFKELMEDNTDLPILNALEGVAVLFTSGVASEQVAFSSIGHTFCNVVHQFLPKLILINDGSYFQHVLSLYMLWQKRIERQGLDADRKKMDERLSELEDHGIKPIGM